MIDFNLAHANVRADPRVRTRIIRGLLGEELSTRDKSTGT
jgi:hypothetical protein